MSGARACCLAAAIALAFVPACRRKTADFKPPQHALFKDVKQQPPVNLPRSAPTIPNGSTAAAKGEPDILILREGSLFQGNVTASGQVVLADGRIEFTTASQPALAIRYRLPTALPAPAPFKGAAEITLVEASNPGGPDTQVLIRTGGAVLFAAVVKKSLEPNRLEIVPGWFVSQMSADVNPQMRLAPSRIEARDPSGAMTAIPVGQVTPVRVSSVLLNVFVSASYRVMPTAREQHAGGYILEGWAVRANQP